MKKNYFIIHGSFGNPYENWFPWLNEKLSREGNAVIVPQFPIGVEFQNYDNWSKLLKYYLDLGLINENTVIIGHSIAPIFIIKFILENKVKLNKLISVSGFNNFTTDGGAFDKVNSTFFVNEDKSQIKNYVNEIICFYSDNDPYLPFDVSDSFANEVSTKKVTIHNGGHFNSDAGYDTFDKLLEYI